MRKDIVARCWEQKKKGGEKKKNIAETRLKKHKEKENH